MRNSSTFRLPSRHHWVVSTQDEHGVAGGIVVFGDTIANGCCFQAVYELKCKRGSRLATWRYAIFAPDGDMSSLLEVPDLISDQSTPDEVMAAVNEYQPGMLDILGNAYSEDNDCKIAMGLIGEIDAVDTPEVHVLVQERMLQLINDLLDEIDRGENVHME